MPAILRCLQRLLRLFKDENLQYMIIGGYALPFYGRIRTTIDIDIAVSIGTEGELSRLCNLLQSNNFEVPVYSLQNPLILVHDRRERVELELWLKPDGIIFDDETLRRRRRVRLDEDIDAWIISPEDFIVNKLARPDRGAVDEQDVKSVLVVQKGRLDDEYLRKRAREAEVLTILENIQAQ